MIPICIHCKFVRIKVDNGIWYNYRCGAQEVKRQEVVDPVSGKTGYGSVNDLGRVNITDEEYPYCREINNGTCSLFQPIVKIHQAGRKLLGLIKR